MQQISYKLFKGLLGAFLLLQLSVNSHAQQMLTLKESRELALKHNNRIGKAREEVDAAKAEIEIAQVAGRPKLDASASVFRFGEPINELLPAYGVTPVLSLTQPLYSGGKIKYGKQVAKTGLEMEMARERLVENEVLLATEMAYWQVVLAKEQIKLEQQVSKQLASHYEFMNNQYGAGLIYKNDVLRAKVQQNENMARMQLAENSLALAKSRLGQLIGMEAQNDIDVADSLTINLQALRDYRDISRKTHPEIEIATAGVESAELTKEIVASDLKPSVGLSLNGLASFGKKGINFGDPASNHMVSYIGMLSINAPIFDWGSKREKVRQQESFVKAARYGLKELESKISLEVEQAALDLQLQAKKINLMEASLIEADENLKLSNDRFEAGTITGEDVLIAETLWQQAYSNMLEAKIRYQIAEATFRKVTARIR